MEKILDESFNYVIISVARLSERLIRKLHGKIHVVLSEEVNSMKQGIHPNYQACTVTCACGNAFETGSVQKEIKVEICAKCHPFFTGKQKLIDTGGRVDRFKKRYQL